MTGKHNCIVLNTKRRFPNAKRYAFSFMALFVCLIIIYSNSFHNTWHFDDLPNIVENRNVHLKFLSWDNVKKSFYGRDYQQRKINRPISYLSFALNHYFGGASVFGYHLVNFVVLYLTAIFLFLLLYNTLLLPILNLRYQQTAYAIALLAVFFWATHPIQVSAVTYIVQRMASMAGMFYIMSIYFYLQFRIASKMKIRIGFLVLCLSTAIFSFASKENAVMLPISILLYDSFFLREVSFKGMFKQIKFFFLLLLVPVLIYAITNLPSILKGYHIRPFTLYERLLTEPRIIVYYLSLLVYPLSSRLTMLHDVEISKSMFVPWTTLPAILVIVFMTATAIRIRRQRPLLAYSIFFFFLNHLIEGSIIPLELVFEHRNYIPSMFVFVPVAVLCVESVNYFSYTKPIQSMLAIAIIFLVAAQGHTTYIYNQVFSNDLTLWNNNVNKSPHLYRPRHSLGKALLAAGLYEEGLREMQKALTLRESARIDQKYTTYHNLGIYYLYHNEPDKALPLFLKSINLHPNNYKAFTAVASIMLNRNAIDRAEKYINVAIRQNPYYSESYYTNGLIYLKKGDIDYAIKAGKKALQIDPDDHKPFFLIAEAYRMENKLAPAVDAFKKYLKQYPEQISAHLALIELYYLLNNRTALKQSISDLMDLARGKNISELILAYHKMDNYLDYSRIERIVCAVQDSISLPSDDLNRLLKQKHAADPPLQS